MAGWNPNENGWDEPEQVSGVYLRLVKKGDKVRIRIASKPYKFTEEFDDQKTGKHVVKTSRAFIVILKELVNGQVSRSVKAFKVGTQIYNGIFNFVSNPDWGDPTTYDFEISRTEDATSFYVVTAMPRPMGPISDAERKLVEEANLDLVRLFSGKDDPEHDPLADDPRFDAAPHPAETDPFA